MQSNYLKRVLKTAVHLATVLLLGAGLASAQQQINLAAGPTSASMPDGSSVPMWGYACGSPVSGSSATCSAANPNAGAGWSPVVIKAVTGSTLQINLTNNLSFTPAGSNEANPIPTSIMIVGQLGGGLGSSTAYVDSPAHAQQSTATWPIAGTAAAGFTPPTQGQRVQSFGTEVTAGSTVSLTWSNLRPGTYLLESGTHPSIQVPMGLYGVLVVTNAVAPDNTGLEISQGTAYPNVKYDAEVPLVFGEIDPVQNVAVNAAVNTINFSETAVWSGQPGQCGNPASANYLTCYPPVVNYSPLYYLINGVAFNRANISASLFQTTPANTLSGGGNILVRLVNAGSRMHVPSIVGSQVTVTAAPVLPNAGVSTTVGGMALVAEDGNPVPGTSRVQNEVFMSAGKTFDVLVNVPATPQGAAAPPALAIYDRELSLSANKINRDAGMLAYIGANGASAPVTPGTITPTATPDAYPSVIAGQTFTVSDPAKGVIANDINIFGVMPLNGSGPSHGSLALNPNGTFSYTPDATWAAASTPTTSDVFTYCGNGATSGAACAQVTLSAQSLELASNIVVPASTWTSKLGTFIKVPSPGILTGATDKAGYPLSVVTSTVSGSGFNSLVVDPSGGFTASVPTSGTSYSFTFQAKNSQGVPSSPATTVTVIFPTPNGPAVTVKDPKSGAVITDYRWIIEEDRTLYQDPNCTTNPPAAGCSTAASGIVPELGVNFHTSDMPYVAQGCTGPQSCEAGQTVVDNNPASPTYLQHVAAVCDQGNGVCRPDISGNGLTPVDPSQISLDPTKRYYISVLPGDAANPFQTGYAGSNCNPGVAPAGSSAPSFSCGHSMGGASVVFPANASAGSTPSAVTVIVEQDPFPSSKLAVAVFEDDFPLNGEQDAGGGVDVLATDEPGLGSFNIILWDDMGGNGDVTGQMTYDMFNQPLSNSLDGTIDALTGLNACPVTQQGNSNPTGITGMITVCPTYESDGKTLSPLAGQAVIANLMPGRFSVQAIPGADRIARGEEWLQTNTLDGQKAHDSFIRIGEPAYFQEFGPANYHVNIGFANPKIINSRLAGVCNGSDPNVTGTNCTNTVTGKITTERMSRTPDERLYGSGSHDQFAWTQCYISVGDPDGEDFAFTKCNPDGTFTLTGLPAGDWRLTTFDQWNDMLLDGLSTPIALGTSASSCTGPTTSASVCDMGDIAINQWQSNVYTRVFIDKTKTGVSSTDDPGIPLINTTVRYRDGSLANNLVTDMNGVANFNETFPLFNWYVVETDTTRYKNSGTHTVYDAGGPADGSSSCFVAANPATQTPAKNQGYPACGGSTIGKFMANTNEQVPLPAALSIPGSVYCPGADCTSLSIQNAVSGTSLAYPSGTGVSTGRIDNPWFGGVEGWQGFSGQSNFVEFGKEPYVAGENGGIKGHVIYASTRPFDDPQMLVQTQWEPLVPHVTMNLYQEGVAADGVTKTLTLVDTTQTTSWDDWAQGFRKDASGNLISDGNGGYIANMNCPGQTTADLFYFSIYNQPEYLDLYNNMLHPGGTGSTTPLPSGSQFKCYDGMHNWNQLQPAVYDGMYAFPSVTATDPVTGKPAKSNCSICSPDTAVPTTDLYYGVPMLPAGKYVVEVVPPQGYEIVKEEDKNILIGDNFIAPVTQEFGGLGDIFIVPDQAQIAGSYNQYNSQNPTQGLGTTPNNGIVPGFTPEPTWPCVGESRVVPDYISLFPQSLEVAPFAGSTRSLCDRKEVTLSDQAGAIAKFYIYTSTHKAAKFTGIITDDFTSEFDPFSPQFGEKFAPPNLPISIKDWTGVEIGRVYSDWWGTYDGMVFSTWEVNPPNPTGYSPNMMVFCMNDKGSAIGTTDPLYNKDYSQFCYELPYMPGQTQYLDTPVVPTSAFSAGYNHPDCSYPDATPAVSEVDGDGVGPWVAGANGAGALASVTLTSPGSNYVAAPTVQISQPGPGGTLAVATATVSGPVTSVALVNGGSGFTGNPTVVFTGGGGSGAAATAGVSGNVSAINVTSGGTGYTSVPTVVITPVGGNGGQAQATAVINGSVASINVLTQGSGYNSSKYSARHPSITLDAPPAGQGCVTAQATATVSASGHITAVTVTNSGSCYTTAPAVHIHTNSGSLITPATLSSTITAVVSQVVMTSNGSGYTAVPAISFTGGGGSGAAATAVLSTGITSITLTAGGSGYTSSPTIGFVGAGGTGASATATINASVTSIVLNNPGSGYTSVPTVSFAGNVGPGGTPATATATISGGQLVIKALGDQTVPNYAYSGPQAKTAPFNQKTITRHFGFGSQCTTPTAGDATCNTASSVTIGGVPATIVSWSDSSIQVNVPATVPACALQQQAQFGGSPANCGQLQITSGNGKQSIDTVSVTVGGKSPTYVSSNNPLTPSGTGSIQQAIDAAQPGDLIIVPPGTYQEMVLMWKPVRLQGVGAASSTIDANAQPAGKLDPWREQVDCLFGIGINGSAVGVTPVNSTTPNVYDPSGTVNCPSNMMFAVDRLPLEAVIGWDATLNGNLAQLLQEPALMGAYEGAGITVLAKGVNFHTTDPSVIWASDTFPTGTTLLTAGDCGAGNTANPYPSNFQCNPSSIDGLTVTDASQGGGGIFVHGWAHNLQIANNRVYGNIGTLSGGINVGQGEFSPGYFYNQTTNQAPGSCMGTFAGPGVQLVNGTLVTNQELPYCFNVSVNVHHNAVSSNTSIGDELFSATPAGAGGVSFCTGDDYYKFNYNWVCGNMSTGDGGGISHLGLSWNGDIEHNTVIFNQSLNPTISTNGGGIQVQGTPDVDPTCGVTTDQDCISNPAFNNGGGNGVSDGIGPGLVINANLIMGNAAEAGSGGGIRLQAINGTDVQNFPGTPAQWYSITVTNNVIANNIAGWDGAGISMQDALAVDFINNTVASNDSTASAGVLFNTLGAPLAGSPNATTQCQGGTAGSGANGNNGNCNPNSTTSAPQPAGLVTMLNSPQLQAAIGGMPAGTNVVCPTNHYAGSTATNGTCMQVSYPNIANDVFWQNRSFYIGVGSLSPAFQNNIISIFNSSFNGSTAGPILSQTITGQCVANSSFWDIGVRGDTGPGNHGSGITLAPTYSLLTSDIEKGAGSSNVTATAPGFVSQYCNGSRTPPEYFGAGGGTWNVPPGISDASVPNPIFNLAPAATVDEGNNWVNMTWGPLSLLNPVTKAQLANYAPASASSPVVDVIPTTSPAYVNGPSTLKFDFFGNQRPDSSLANRLDIGAIEWQGSAPIPVISSITPSKGYRGFTRNVTITGSYLTGANALNGLTGTGITVSNFTVVNANTITATFAIANNAPLTTDNLSITTPVQTSNTVAYTVATAVKPTGYVDGAHDATTGSTTVGYADQLVVRGWAADPQDNAPVSQVQIFIDGHAVGTATLGLIRLDVAKAYNNQAWLNSGWSFTAAASTLTAGSHQVYAVATDSFGLFLQLGPTRTFTVTAAPKPPVGSLEKAADAKNNSTTVQRGDNLLASGWAADQISGAPVSQVQIFIDGNAVGLATLGIARPDIAASQNNPNFLNSGWTFTYSSTATMSLGTHTVTAVATDPAHLSAQLTNTITINVVAVPPFGVVGQAYDSVTKTATVSKSHNLVVNGWAADVAQGAPVSQVQIFIDGHAAGTATLGIARPDVVKAYNNSAYLNSGFTFTYPAAGLATGPHHVTAVATDSFAASATLNGSLTITVQ